MEAVCDFLEGILDLVDPHLVLERLFSPLLDCGDALIDVRLDVGHYFSLKSGLPLAHFIKDLLCTVFNYLSCHCYVFLALLWSVVAVRVMYKRVNVSDLHGFFIPLSNALITEKGM